MRNVLMASMLALASCTPAAVAPDQAADVPPEVSALAHIYTLAIAGAVAAPDQGECLIKLDAEDVDAGDSVVRRAWIDPACYDALPIVRGLNQWSPNAFSGVQLIDADHATIVDFRPVADDTGDYLAGPAGDGATYELRTPSW